MLYRRRLRKPPPGVIFTFILLVGVFFILTQVFFMVERRYRPAITALAEIKADAMATDTINYAILDKVAHRIHYNDLIITKQDEQGRIVMAQVNSMEVNQVMANTTIATREALLELEDEPFYIPLGEAMDSYILATYGPKIPIRMVPLGRVNTEVIDSFEEAGINQTRHKIYLQVHTEVQIIVPFIKESVEVVTTIPVADSIYIGEVPETVINLTFP